jgi:hypothetical protein
MPVEEVDDVAAGLAHRGGSAFAADPAFRVFFPDDASYARLVR